MKLHANAALSLNGRRRLVRLVIEEGRSIAAAAEAAAASERTCAKWVGRYRTDGEAGLWNRSSAPGRLHNRTDEPMVQLLASLRRMRFTAPELADLLDIPVSTISGILKRIGLGKLGRLGLEPAQRYERARPGELVHIDVKKLGRIERGAGHRVAGRRHYTPRLKDRAGIRRGTTGWECVHVAVDDATRLVYAEVLADEKATTTVAFLRRAVAAPAWRHRATPADRQRRCVYLCHTRDRLPRTRHPTSPDPPPPTPDQRQKPNDSSARCWPAGPTARSTAQATNAPQPLTAGSGTTTITANTQPSGDNHPSPS